MKMELLFTNASSVEKCRKSAQTWKTTLKPRIFKDWIWNATFALNNSSLVEDCPFIYEQHTSIEMTAHVPLFPNQVFEQTLKLWFSPSWPKPLMWTTHPYGNVCNVERRLNSQPTWKTTLKPTTSKTYKLGAPFAPKFSSQEEVFGSTWEATKFDKCVLSVLNTI